jgi:membrane protease YdiL (CAAX protease family)
VAEIGNWDLESPAAPVVVLNGASRRHLVWETRFVMFAFLFPAISSAVIAFIQHVSGVGNITRFPVLVAHHPVTNLVVGIISYFSVAAVIPIALLLLVRSGDGPSSIGLGAPRWRTDIWPGLGLAGAAFLAEIPLAVVLSPLLLRNSSLVSKVSIGHVPGYYVIWGVSLSATTAIAEEVMMNGYLMTRLGQLGWTPRSALILSLSLRTSYHVYYGLGFLLTVPFGYLVTRSFQNHRRLNRPITAHFIFDAVLATIAILA